MIVTVAPTVFNLTVDANADLDLELQWTLPNGTLIDLTGYSAVLTIASDFYTNPNRIVYHTSSSSGMSPEITFPTPSAGLILIDIPAAVTSLFTFQTAVYDLLLTSGSGAVVRLLQGPVTIDPGVTDDRP
jgi:hypothetical protein